MIITIFFLNKYSTNRQLSLTEIIIILAFVIVATIILQRIKSKRKSFEENIIHTISTNRILDQNFFNGLSSEDMKIAIRQEIKKKNVENDMKFIDLDKMVKLMEELTFENLQKLYQWFFYKG